MCNCLFILYLIKGIIADMISDKNGKDVKDWLFFLWLIRKEKYQLTAINFFVFFSLKCEDHIFGLSFIIDDVPLI